MLQPDTRRLYVSPTGDDACNGASLTRSGAGGPFRSLDRALTAVVELRNHANCGDIHIILGGGRYELDQTVVVTPDHLSKQGYNLTLRAAEGETPVFSGGRAISNWTRLTSENAPPDLPDAAQGHVFVADVSARLARFGSFKTLFDDEGLLPRAAEPSFQPTWKPGNRSDILEEHENLETVHFPPGAMRQWDNLQDVELCVYPMFWFVMNILPVASVDVAQGIAHTAVPATYPMMAHEFPGDATRLPAWIENTTAGLGRPGNWALNTLSGLLYYWPRNGDLPGSVYAPHLRELLRFEGDESAQRYVRHVRVEGLTFSHADRDTWQRDDASLQHDWAMYHKSDALVRFVACEDCAVSRCRFIDSGGNGLRVDQHGRRISVDNCEFAHLGIAGIILCGYGPGTHDVNGDHTVIHNHLHHLGTVIHHGIGIIVWQSGRNLIARNQLEQLPYIGIAVCGVRPEFFTFRRHLREGGRTIRWSEIPQTPLSYEAALAYLHGRDNVVEENDVHHCMTQLGDGNGIYVSGSGTGNQIRQNYVHDIAGRDGESAIRIDDHQLGTVIADNRIERCSGGITLKHNNDVIGNWIADLLPRVHSKNGRVLQPNGYLDLRRGPVNAALIRHNILVRSSPEQPFICEGRGHPDWVKAYLHETQSDFNTYIDRTDPASAQKFLELIQSRGTDFSSSATLGADGDCQTPDVLESITLSGSA